MILKAAYIKVQCITIYIFHFSDELNYIVFVLLDVFTSIFFLLDGKTNQETLTIAVTTVAVFVIVVIAISLTLIIVRFNAKNKRDTVTKMLNVDGIGK